jgi:hypothetical protein
MASPPCGRPPVLRIAGGPPTRTTSAAVAMAPMYFQLLKLKHLCSWRVLGLAIMLPPVTPPCTGAACSWRPSQLHDDDPSAKLPLLLLSPQARPRYRLPLLHGCRAPRSAAPSSGAMASNTAAAAEASSGLYAMTMMISHHRQPRATHITRSLSPLSSSEQHA